MAPENQVIIIGGGFYGLRIAQFLSEELGVKKIVVLEQENEVMKKASYNNQARIHGGYHYPRSILTALRSKVNLPRFVEEYRDAVDDTFINYYAIAKHFSKVSSRQFHEFYKKIDAPIEQDNKAQSLFNKTMIDKVFRVKEYAFSSTRLKQQLLERISKLDIKVLTSQTAQRVEKHAQGLRVITDKAVMRARSVINTTYAGINTVNSSSNLPLAPLKYELTELCLVEVPPPLRGKSFTVMCGPFFSLMPFPSQAPLYTLSHVNHTPHTAWQDDRQEAASNAEQFRKLSKLRPRSHFPKMIADVKKYLPEAANIIFTGRSLWEVKTVLVQNESNDGRPILFSPDHGGLPNYTCIMGGKIDNIYEVFEGLGAVI